MNLIPLFIAIPLGTAFVIVLLGRTREIYSDILATIAALILAILPFVLILTLDKGETLVYSMGKWLPPQGINLVLDGLSRLMLIIINVVGFLAIVYSVSYMKKSTPEYREQS